MCLLMSHGRLRELTQNQIRISLPSHLLMSESGLRLDCWSSELWIKSWDWKSPCIGDVTNTCRMSLSNCNLLVTHYSWLNSSWEPPNSVSIETFRCWANTIRDSWSHWRTPIRPTVHMAEIQLRREKSSLAMSKRSLSQFFGNTENISCIQKSWP